MSKKIFAAIMVLTLLIAGAAAAFGIQHSAREATVFWGDGYVLSHQSGENGAVVPAPIYFTAGTRYKTSYDGRITFKDMYGDKQEVSADAFIHYADESISTFHSGVVMEMNEISRGLLNYYSLGEDSIMNRQGEGYLLDNQGTPLEFHDYIWKIEEDRFLISSPELQLTLPDGSTEDLSGYLELEYVDKGIVRLSNSQQAFQMLALGSSLRLSDGSLLHLEDRSVEKDGQVNVYLQEILLDEMSGANIPVVPSETKPAKVPTFDITTIDGEEGMAGQDGEAGEMGEEGEEGKSGDAGEAGEEGEEGEEGDEGQDGDEGAEGDSGSDGKSGEAGSTGATGGTGGGGTGGQDKVVMPVYVLSEFDYDVTQGSGTIDVDNAEEVNGVELLHAKLSILNTADNAEIDSEEYEADQLSSFSPLEFKIDGLDPDNKYKLMFTASYRLTDSEAEADAEGERTFLTRTFSTTSFGILEEYGYATDNSLSVNLKKMEYAGNDPVRVVLFDKEGQEQGRIPVNDTDWKESGNIRTCEALFEELDSNTAYTVRVEVLDPATGAYVEVSESEYRTLKKAPQILKVPVVANSPKGYFEIRPDMGTEDAPGIVDEDHAITAYRYDLYIYAGGKQGDLVTSVYGEGTTATAIYVDNKQVLRGQDYVARLVAEYHDNEKIVEVESEPTEFFFMDEYSGVPYLVFTENKEIGGVQFNQIIGSMSVELNQANLDISDSKPLVLTVYNEQFGEVDYYRWNSRPDNLERLTVPVYLTGLKENTTYRFTLHGYYKDQEAGQQLTTTIAKTPPSKTLKAVMKETSVMGESIHPLNAEIWFDYGAEAEHLEGGQYEAQQINAIHLTLTGGGQTRTKDIPVAVRKTETEWGNPVFPDAPDIKYIRYESDFPELYFDLEGNGEPKQKLVVDNTLFGLADDAVIGSQYSLKVEYLYDYTWTDEYRYEPEHTTPNQIKCDEKTNELVLRPIGTMPTLPKDSVEVTQILRGKAEALGIPLTEEMEELPPNTVVGFAVKPNYDNSSYYADAFTVYAFDRSFYEENIEVVKDELRPLEALKKMENGLEDLVWTKKKQTEWGSTLPGIIFMMGKGDSGKVTDRDGGFYDYEYRFFPKMERGRRYAFAYDVALEISDVPYTYPYDSTAYKALPFPDGILKSEKGDSSNPDQIEAPRATPELKLYPYTVKSGEVCWQVNAQDPDGALHKESFRVSYGSLTEPIKAKYKPPVLPESPTPEQEEQWKEAYGEIHAELPELAAAGTDIEETLVLSGNYILFYDGEDPVKDRDTVQLSYQPYRQYTEPVLQEITQDVVEGNKRNALIFKLQISGSGEHLPKKLAGVRLDLKPTPPTGGLETKTLYVPVSYVSENTYQVEISKDAVSEFFGKEFDVTCHLLYPWGEYGYGMGMKEGEKAILMTNRGSYISYDPEETKNPLTESPTVYHSMMNVYQPLEPGKHGNAIYLESPYEGDNFRLDIPVTYTSAGAENSTLLNQKVTLVPIALQEGEWGETIEATFDQITPVVSSANAEEALEEAVFTFTLTENVEDLLEKPEITFILSYKDEKGSTVDKRFPKPLSDLKTEGSSRYRYTFEDLNKGTTYTVALEAKLAGAGPEADPVRFLNTKGEPFTYNFTTLTEITVKNPIAHMNNQYYNHKTADLTFGLSSVTGIQVRLDLYDVTGVTDLNDIPDRNLALSYEELIEYQDGAVEKPYSPDKKRFYATGQESLNMSGNFARLDLSGPIDDAHGNIRLNKGHEYRWKISVYPKGTNYEEAGYEGKIAGLGWSNAFQYPQLNTPISQINIRPVPPEDPKSETRELIVQPVLGETPGDANGSIVASNAFVVLDGEKGLPVKDSAGNDKLVGRDGQALTGAEKARGAYVVQLLEADYGQDWEPGMDPVEAKGWNLLNIVDYCGGDQEIIDKLTKDAIHGMISIPLEGLKADWEYKLRIYAVEDPDLIGKAEIEVPTVGDDGIPEDLEKQEGVTMLAEVTQRTVGQNGLLIDEERIDVEQLDAGYVGINIYDAVGLEQVKFIMGNFLPKAMVEAIPPVPLPTLPVTDDMKTITSLSDGTTITTIKVPASFAVKGTYNAVIRFYGDDISQEPLLNRTYPLKVTDVAVRLSARLPVYRPAALLPEKKQIIGKEKAHA